MKIIFEQKMPCPPKTYFTSRVFVLQTRLLGIPPPALRATFHDGCYSASLNIFSKSATALKTKFSNSSGFRVDDSCNFQKIVTGKISRSAGTVRSRRCQSAKKGFGGKSHQQAKREVSAQAEISRFLHLCIQMPSLQGTAEMSTAGGIEMRQSDVRVVFC